jgi:hypothetical protein
VRLGLPNLSASSHPEIMWSENLTGLSRMISVSIIITRYLLLKFDIANGKYDHLGSGYQKLVLTIF